MMNIFVVDRDRGDQYLDVGSTLMMIIWLKK